MAEDRSIRVRLIADVGNYRTAMMQAGASTKEFGREISGQGKATTAQMEMVGRSALIMAGVIGAGLGLAVKAAVDWESSWADVTKTVDGSATQMAGLEEGLRSMAKELPATHGEIAEVAAAAGQLGVRVEDIESFTRTMIDLGETTNLTADQAATSMARFANIMGTPTSDVDRLGSSVVELGNNSATTESEIMEMGLRIAGAGAQIGLTEGEVVGFAAALSSVGIEAQAGGTAISRVMLDIRQAVDEGADSLDTLAEVAGVSSDEFAAAYRGNAGEAIVMFVEGLGRMEAAGENSNAVLAELGMSDIRVGDALRRLAGAGDLLSDSLEMGNQSWEDNTALAEEAAQRYETTAAKLEVFRNTIVDLGIDAGGVLLPALTAIADGATSVGRGIGEMPGPLRTATVGLGGLAFAGLGAVGVIGTMAPKVIAARDALMNMGTAGQFVGRNMGAMATAAGVAGVAIGVLAYVMGENAKLAAESEARIQGFTDAIRETGDAASGTEAFLTQMLESAEGRQVTEMLDEAGLSAQEFAAAVSGTDEEWQSFLDRLGEGGTLVGHTLSGIRDEALEAAEHVDTLGEVVVQTGDDAAGAVPGLEGMEDGLDGVGTEAEEAKSALEQYADTLKGLFDPTFAYTSAITANTDALDEEAQAQAELDLLRLSGTATSEDLEAAERRLRDAHDGVTTSAVDLATKEAQLFAALNSGEITVGEMRDELDRLEDQGYLSAAAADEMRRKIDEIESKHVEVNADDNATPKIDAAGRALDGIDGSTAWVRIEAMLPSLGWIGRQLGKTVPQRMGGIVHSYAAGGLHAHVARDEMIRYGEPATGGEAFIPRIGDAARSTAVLEEAASWYGLTVLPAGGYGPPMAGATSNTAGNIRGGGGTVIQNLTLQTPDPPRQWLDEVPWRVAS